MITRAANDILAAEDTVKGLSRHATGDWGDMSEDDKQANEDALVDGYRLMSSYRDREDNKYWIITEADRSVTTVLLPSDY